MRHVVVAQWVLGASFVGACADDVATFDAPLQPQCGSDGPVTLVELAEDEVIGSFWRYGDDEGSILTAVVAAEPPPAGELAAVKRHLVVDRCGEELGRTSVDVGWLTPRHDEVFGCSRDGQLLHLRTIDDPDPTIVTRGSCYFAEVAGVLVGKDVDPETSDEQLVTITVAPDGVHRSTLLAGLQPDDDPVYPPTIYLVEDLIFAQLAADGSVHSVDPATGQVQLEVASAGDFYPQPRAIAYRPTILADGETGPVRVRARESGAEVTVVENLPADAGLYWHDETILRAFASDTQPLGRWFALSPLHEIVPPTGTEIVTIREDGLIWLQRDHEDWRTDFLQWHEGQDPVVVMECKSCFAGWPFDHGDLYVGVNTVYPERLEVWRVRSDGSAPTKVAYPVNNDYDVLDDGRILAVDDVSQTSAYGPFLLFDGNGGPGHTIAEHVERHAATATRLYATPGDVIYEALHDDGTGALYRARLAPP